MPRTYTWSESQPVGSSTPAAQIDDQIRKTKLELREIINQLMGVAESTVLADPVIAVASHIAALKALTDANAGTVSLILTLPWYGVRAAEAGTVTMSKDFYKITGASATGTLFIPVALPVGVTITEVAFRLFRNSTNHLMTLNFHQMTGPTIVTTNTVAAPGISASAQWAATGVISIVTAVDQYFGFEVILNNQNLDTGIDLGLYGVRVKYNSPTAKVRI